MTCRECGTEFDPIKDLFIRVHERKGPSVNLCSLGCVAAYLADES